MKKTIVLMLSLLFALSFPLLSIAAESGEGPMDEQEAVSPVGHRCAPDMRHGESIDPSTCMEMRHGGGRHGEFGHMDRSMVESRLPWFYIKHAKDLKLNDEQVASLKKISFDCRKEMITKVAEMKVKKLELREILDKPDYKLEDATAKLKEIEDARLALETSALQHATQARDVLTPEQLKKAKDLRGHDHYGKSCGKEMKRHMGPRKK